MPIRSRASAEGQALQSGLFPTQKGGSVCRGAGGGRGGEGGDGSRGGENSGKSLLSFFPLLSLTPCSVSTLMKISLHSFFYSPRIHSEQFGAN